MVKKQSATDFMAESDDRLSSHHSPDTDLQGGFDDIGDDDSSATEKQAAGCTGKKNAAAKLTVAMLALLLAAGALFYLKYSHAHPDKIAPEADKPYGSVTQSDIAEPVSSEPIVSEPEEVSSEIPEEKPVYKELKMEDKNNDVLKLQKRLCELGYFDKYKCTGYYGNYTTKIVKNFQKAVGLPVTGIADQATQERLYADDAPVLS